MINLPPKVSRRETWSSPLPRRMGLLQRLHQPPTLRRSTSTKPREASWHRGKILNIPLILYILPSPNVSELYCIRSEPMPKQNWRSRKLSGWRNKTVLKEKPNVRRNKQTILRLHGRRTRRLFARNVGRERQRANDFGLGLSSKVRNPRKKRSVVSLGRSSRGNIVDL